MAHDEFPPLLPPPSKPQPTGGRLIRSDVDPARVAPADTSSLVAIVRDAIAHEPWETESQAAILAVAKWLRSVGNCGSASELEREATK